MVNCRAGSPCPAVNQHTRSKLVGEPLCGLPLRVPLIWPLTEQLLGHFGFHLSRRGKEDVWRNDATGRIVVVARGRSSGQIPVGTVRSILRQAGISREEALGFWGIA